MNREKLDQFCERGILGLVLAILVIGPLALGAVGPIGFLAILGLTMAVLVLWAARIWLKEKPQLLWPPVCWAVIAFTGYAIARYFPADIEYIARQELLRVLIYAALFFAIINNLYRQEAVQWVTLTLAFLAMAIASYGIFQFLTNSNHIWWFVKPYQHRASGTYVSPNHLGGFLELILPMALAFTLASRLNIVVKIVLGYASLVILTGIAMTLSRGAWIAATGSLLVFFTVLAFRRQYRLASFLFFALIIAGCFILVPKSHLLQKRARQVTETGRVDDDSRFSIWTTAFQLWRENPLWGIGPAHFDARFREVRPESIQLQPYRVHNDYLNTLTDWGIVGAACMCAALLLLAGGVFKTWRFVRGASRDIGEKTNSNRFAFVLGASCGLLALAIHSLLDFNMHIPANAIVAVTLIALLSSHLRFATDKCWLTLRPWMKAVASVALLAAVIYFAVQEVCRARENCWLVRANRAGNFSPQQVNFLKKAFEVEPKNALTAYRIGEAMRRQAQEGGSHYSDDESLDYRARATQAMAWFERSSKLNLWNGYSYLGYGWCLDWLERTNESAPYFSKAEELDPKGYYTLAMVGLHYMELGRYAAAREYFERSARLEWVNNPIPRNYLQLIETRLLEAATNNLIIR